MKVYSRPKPNADKLPPLLDPEKELERLESIRQRKEQIKKDDEKDLQFRRSMERWCKK